jgi:hypothetical protein
MCHLKLAVHHIYAKIYNLYTDTFLHRIETFMYGSENILHLDVGLCIYRVFFAPQKAVIHDNVYIFTNSTESTDDKNLTSFNKKGWDSPTLFSQSKITLLLYIFHLLSAKLPRLLGLRCRPHRI